VRALGVGLWLVGAAAGAVAQLAPAPDPVGADSTFLEVADVRVHGAGPGTLSETQVRSLEVELSRVASGWVGPRRELPRERVRIGDLGAEPLRVYGSALEAIEDALARAHAREGRAGVSVELRPGAVRFERDGQERRNLIEAPEHKARVESMRSRLRARYGASGCTGWRRRRTGASARLRARGCR